MFLAIGFLAASTLITALGVFGSRANSSDKNGVLYCLLQGCVAPGAGLSFAAAVVIVGSIWYHGLLSDRSVSWDQSQFFAVQTVTTVGYGGGLTALDPPGKKATEKEKEAWRRKREDFYFYSSILMLLGMGGVGIFVAGAASSVVEMARKGREVPETELPRFPSLGDYSDA